MRKGMIALGLILVAAGCQPAPPVDSFCEKLIRKDFTDPGLRAQNPHNKRADLVNENTWKRDCGPG